MTSPWLGIPAVMALLGGMLLVVRWIGGRLRWHPETSRKAVHIGMGLACLSFPWVFRDPWPVALLAAVACAALGSIRLVPAVRSRLGGVLGGVERESWGELVFPPSVAFVFWLARGDAILFCVPVLILTLADAVAALIGARYGRVRYETDDGSKSIEGSLAFFIVAFLSTHSALLLFSPIGRLESLLIAAVMGFILVLIEAIAWHGLDNAFIPIVSHVCLVRMMDRSVPDLGARLAVLVGVIAALSFLKRATRLTGSAAIGAALLAYVTWAVGDWRWWLPPAVAASAYGLLCRRPASDPRLHRVFAVASIGGVGLLWLSLPDAIGTARSLHAYWIAYAANLGMIGLAHYADPLRSRSTAAAVPKAIALGYGTLALPLVVLRPASGAAGWVAGSLLLVGAAVTAFAVWQPSPRACPADGARWTRQAVLSGAVSFLAFLWTVPAP